MKGTQALLPTFANTDALFAGNTARGYGGGILSWGGDLAMTNAVFQGNAVVPTISSAWRSSGGGLSLWSYQGRVNLENVTLSANSAPLAEGIHVSGAVLAAAAAFSYKWTTVVCKVDPNGAVSELLENNNTCNSDSVGRGLH